MNDDVKRTEVQNDGGTVALSDGPKSATMKKRVISGVLYVAILVLFYLLKIFVPSVGNIPLGDFCFDALVYAFALIGTFEMLRAVKDKTTKFFAIFHVNKSTRYNLWFQWYFFFSNINCNN